jgi:hypothetical protein
LIWGFEMSVVETVNARTHKQPRSGACKCAFRQKTYYRGKRDLL